MNETGTVTVVDVVQALGPGAQVMRGLRSASLAARVMGPAYTCSCAAGDNLAIHAALTQAPPGSVIVADADGRADGGYFGELMATDAMNRRLGGAVVLGAIRDLRQIEALGFPVFFQALCPASCVKRRIGSVGEPLVVDGVAISAGDMVLADADGMVIVDQQKWPEILQRATEVMDAEAKTEDALHQGQWLADVLSLPL
jgi:4-hydroxy-4-methyl-2-oxoglutarate aldolase